MLIYLLSALVCCFLKLHNVILHLQYMLPVVLFIACVNWAKAIMLLYFVTLAYDIIEFLVMRLT